MDALDGLKKSIDELGAATTNHIAQMDRARDLIKRLMDDNRLLRKQVAEQVELIDCLRSQVVEVN